MSTSLFKNQVYFYILATKRWQIKQEHKILEIRFTTVSCLIGLGRLSPKLAVRKAKKQCKLNCRTQLEGPRHLWKKETKEELKSGGVVES